jgi:hypothetical protein
MQSVNKDEVIAKLITQHLTDTPNGTALSILRGVHTLNTNPHLVIVRADVNRVLYHNAAFESSPGPSGSARLWKLRSIPVPEPIEDTEFILVVVDLGNVHDALQPLHVMVEDGQVDEVWAFADKAFNGVGINPPPQLPEIKVFVAPDRHRNSADTLLIWKLKEFVDLPTSKGAKIIVITKDQGFLTLKTLIDGTARVNCDICSSWTDAKQIILGAK